MELKYHCIQLDGIR